MINHLGCWKNTRKITRLRLVIYEFFSCSTNIPSGLSAFIIQLLYTVRFPILWLVDLCHVTLSCDEITTLTSLSWCNSRGVNSTHHCHYTMASADSNFDDFCCSVFNLNNKNVNALIARELSGFTSTRSLTMNSKFSTPYEAASCGIEICRSLLVNSCR